MDKSNTSRFWTSRRLPDLGLMVADFTTHEYAPHAHEALVVAVTEWGGAEVQTRGSLEHARRSVLLVFNPAEPHWGRMAGWKRWRYRSFYLGPAGIEALCQAIGIGHLPHFGVNLFDDEGLARRFLVLHRALEDGGDSLQETELLYETFACLIGRGPSQVVEWHPSREAAAPLREIVEYLGRHYMEGLSLESLARRFRLTPFQLIRCFKKSTGFTPYAYLTQIRLEAACSLLRQGEAIAAIAPAVGFYDQSALTRHFKRTLGITPVQFLTAANSQPGLGIGATLTLGRH